MLNSIRVFSGREKIFRLTWRQSLGSNGPPINLTGAVVGIHGTTLPARPIINIVDRDEGTCDLVFSEESTRGAARRSTPHEVWISLTFTGAPGHSPDPVKIPVVVMP